MKSLSKRLIIAALLAITGTTALAGSGGSAYSILGLGDILYAPGVRSNGMGYTGIALPGSGYINPFSPATWARINRTRIEGGLQYVGYNSTDGVKSRMLARADFDGAMLAVPISPADGIVVGVGFTPYSSYNYDTYTRGGFHSATDTLDYQLHHTGGGGITKGVFGLSYTPWSSLAIGGSVNYMFGTLTHSQQQQVVGSNYAGATTDQNITATGLTWTLGAVYTGLGDITEALRPLAIGFVVTTRGNLKARHQSTYSFTSGADTSAELQSRIVIPFSLSLGAAYQLGDRWLFAADYQTQAWSTSEILSATPEGIRNSHRFGVGAERVPSKELHADWVDRIAYRFGGYYNATYYQPNGQPIDEYGVTGGLGFPLAGETRMNVAIEYATRGTTANNLIKDHILRMSVSLNVSELWFVRYEEE